MEKFIMADGVALRVRDSGGEGPAAVLLHGYLETMEIWDAFIPLLKGLRVLALDLPGHGVSEIKGEVHTMEFLARTVQAAMKAVGVEKYCVVGHSMGGYVALEVLRLFPDSLTGIVLLHSTANADSPEKLENRQREVDIVLAGKKELLARTLPATRYAPENRRRLKDWIDEGFEMATLMEDDGITAIIRGMAARCDNNATLEGSPVPQLFILGRHDELIPPSGAEQFAAAHPGAQTAWLEHSGHMGFIEEPELTARIITDFIISNDR